MEEKVSPRLLMRSAPARYLGDASGNPVEDPTRPVAPPDMRRECYRRLAGHRGEGPAPKWPWADVALITELTWLRESQGRSCPRHLLFFTGRWVNKGEKRKGQGLTLRPFGDGSRITLGPRNLVVRLAKATVIH